MFEVLPDPSPMSSRDPSDMEDLFELFFSGGSRPYKPISMQGDIGWRPATDVYETVDEFIIQMDLAGMRRSEIEVHVEEDFVILKGVRSNIAPPGKKHFHKMEIQVGPFERHVRVPPHIDPTTARAFYSSGFLFIRMKRGEGRLDRRRTVEIES